jgi:hypothetical protein
VRRSSHPRPVVASAFVLLALLFSRPAAAQTDPHRFQVGAQLAGVVSSEFDGSDVGLGARFSWHAAPVLGAEAEFNFYPGDFADAPAFSSGRVEGLFGVTLGPRLGRHRVFAKLRPGFVNFRAASEPFACIAIFPPPLSCTLAAGKTVFAIDFGGGLEFFPTAGTFVRVDVGDRVMRYPRTVLENDGGIREGAFSSHDFRFAIGAGLRF